MRRAARWLPKVFTPDRLRPERNAIDLVRKLKKRPSALVSVSAVALLFLALGLGLLWRRRRQRGGRRRNRRGQRRSSALYHSLLRRLERRGHDKKDSDTALEFLRAIEHKGDAEEASVTRDVTLRYLQARFGDSPLGAREEAELAARVKALGDSSRPPTARP